MKLHAVSQLGDMFIDGQQSFISLDHGGRHVFYLFLWSNQKQKMTEYSLFVQMWKDISCLYNHMIPDYAREILQRKL